MSDTSDNKEMTIDERAELWASLLFTFDTGQRYGKKGYIQGFHDCQQLYGGLTPEQVRGMRKHLQTAVNTVHELSDYGIEGNTTDFAKEESKFLSTLSKGETR